MNNTKEKIPVADTTTATAASSQDTPESTSPSRTRAPQTNNPSRDTYIQRRPSNSPSSVIDSQERREKHVDDHDEDEAILDARSTQAAFTGVVNGYIHKPVGTAVKTELKCQMIPPTRPVIQDEHVAHIQESCYNDPGYQSLLTRVAHAGGVGDENQKKSPLQPSSTRASLRSQSTRRSARFSGDVQVQAFRRYDQPTKSHGTSTKGLDDAKDRRAWLRATARSRAASKALARARRPPGKHERFMKGDDHDAILEDFEDEDEDDSDDTYEEDKDAEGDEEDGDKGDLEDEAT
ncbi:hypothetical protein BDV97DRAFT_366700 [Delphinella strobiligena]|nr:hypothetical protein BDV97DRAFT_366700 [Delphinella strobiligena]